MYGELVVCRAGGLDFMALQRRLTAAQRAAAEAPATFVFDVLAAGGTDLHAHPYRVRRALLLQLLDDASPPLAVVPMPDGEGARARGTACARCSTRTTANFSPCPDDDQLIADITAPTYTAAGARYKVEQKDEVKRRIGRSPDLGDALAYALWTNLHRQAGTAHRPVAPDAPHLMRRKSVPYGVSYSMSNGGSPFTDLGLRPGH